MSALRIIDSPNSNALIKAWDTKLRMESSAMDIFSGITGVYVDEKKTIPNSVLVEANADTGTFEKTITLLLELSGAATTGRSSLLDNLETQAVRTMNLYANEVKHGVQVEKYGIDKVAQDVYKIYDQANEQLSKWHGLQEGMYWRQGLAEGFSYNLTVAPTSQTVRINKNVFIAGVASGSQPVYDSTLADFKTAIDTAIPNTTTASNQASVSVLNALAGYVVDKEIEPIMMNGKPMYILTIPTRQAIKLRDPSNTASLADLYIDADVRGNDNKAIKGYIGNWGPFILVEDPRAPVVDIPTGSPSTISFGYRGPGTQDTRASADDDAWDVGYLLGKGAAIKLVSERLHFEDEIQDFKRYFGVGAFATYGVVGCEYDLDSGSQTDASRYNKNSAIVLFASAIS